MWLASIHPERAFAPYAVLSRAFLVLATVIVATLTLLLIGGWTDVRNRLMPEARFQATALNMTNMVGRLLFYNVYLAGGHWNNDVVFTGQPLDQGQAFIRASDGPASAELIDVLRTKLTPERIAFAKRMRRPALIHTSTCFVAGNRSGDVWEDEELDGYFPRRKELPGTRFSVEQEMADNAQGAKPRRLFMFALLHTGARAVGGTRGGPGGFPLAG